MDFCAPFAWIDEMDFTDQNPLISSILNCISQITGVIYTVIALNRGPAQNFTVEKNELFMFCSLPSNPHGNTKDS